MTHGLPQTGQKFLWDAECVWCDVLQLWGGKKREASAHLSFLALFSKWLQSCEAPRTKSGHRVSKELFTVRWMGTGDTGRSHPVTICTGVMLVIQIGHRCSGITWASMQIFGRVTKCLVPQFMEYQVDPDASFFYRFIWVFQRVDAFFHHCKLPVFAFSLTLGLQICQCDSTVFLFLCVKLASSSTNFKLSTGHLLPFFPHLNLSEG